MRTITRVLPKINHNFYNVVIILDVFAYDIQCFEDKTEALAYAKAEGGYLFNDKLKAA